MTVSCRLCLLLAILPLAVAQQTRCWTTSCPGDEDYCVQQCLPGQTHCLANYLSHADGTISPGIFQCYQPPTPEDCSTSTCNPVASAGGVSSCCCTGDLCNDIPGLTPGSLVTVPSFTTSVPTGTVPVRPDGHLICEFSNCSLLTDPTTQTCYHGYEVCAEGDRGTAFPDHDTHYCQALYKYNTSIQLYELFTKGCHYSLIPSCTANECFIDTDATGQREQFIRCCCDGLICNVNVTFADPAIVVPGVAPECGGLNCNHSCIIENGVPRCYCDQGHFLSEADNSSCIDVDECNTGAHLCQLPARCINELGTYSCDCDAADNLRISDDGRSCERTGLVCAEFICAAAGDCSTGVQYCDDAFLEGEPVDFDKEHCQATYRLLPDGTAEAALLSCQIGTQIGGCTHGQCNLMVLDGSNSDILYCCCKGTLCSSNLVFPNNTIMMTVPTLEPSPTPTDQPTTPGPVGKKRTDVITFTSVVVVVVLIAVFVVIAIVCFYRRHQKRQLDDRVGLHDPEALISAASPFLIATPILVSKIGRGKFAIVFKGKIADCFVAVKCFEDSAQGRDSFSRELDIYKTPELGHRNILQFLGPQPMYWLVFEYHAQGSLCNLLKQRTVTLEQFLDLSESAAAGLAYLHNEKIVDDRSKKPAIAHRDLKSKNILVKTNGQCCISDLGLAIRLDQGENLNEAHGQVGTSRYMAPEVLEGAINFQRESFLRIDIYALGLILYEISTRTTLPNANVEPYRPPFDGFVSSNPTIEEMTAIVVQQQRRPEIPVCFRVDLELDTIAETITEAWDHDAEARLSAQCIEERIRTFRANHVSKAGPQVSKSREEVSKDSGRETDSDPFSQLPDTPSLSSSVTMSPLEPKPSVASRDPFSNASRIAASNETVCLRSFRQDTQQWNENHRSGMMNYSHSTETTV